VTPSELQPKRVRKLASFMNENFEAALNNVTSIR